MAVDNMEFSSNSNFCITATYSGILREHQFR